MEYRKLGGSGLQVSPICLGAMMFGDRTDEATARSIVASAQDAGINFIDTADVYTKGESERMVGKLIASSRGRWVLATKVGNPMGDGPNQRGLSRKWVMQAINMSLTRLNTDYVDIYYLHRDDYETSLEETLGVVADVIKQGKARYWGISNYRAWRIVTAVHLCRQLGVPQPIVCQPYYNAMNRMPEVEILPTCAHYGIGVVPYSPLARGVLTGKYQPDEAAPEDTRAGRKDTRMMQTEFRAESLAMAQEIKAHAEARGMTAGQFAVNWVLNNSLISAVIAGPRTLEQWSEYLGALEHQCNAEDEALIDRLVKPGHPSTPGYTDPKDPVRGRTPRF